MSNNKQKNSQQLSSYKICSKEELAAKRSYYEYRDETSHSLYNEALKEKILDEAKAQFRPWNNSTLKSINLRYLYEDDVFDVLDEIIEYIENLYKYRNHDKKLKYEIIVGRGNGSKDYIQKLHPEVLDYLTISKISYKDLKSSFLAYLEI